MECPHGQKDKIHCQICIARSWKTFQDAVLSARERLSATTVPAMLVCVNPETGEIDVVVPEWLKSTRDTITFLQHILKRQRRRIRLE